MNKKKPEKGQEYVTWLKDEFDIILDNRSQTYYNAVTSRILSDFEKSNIWESIKNNFKEIDAEYKVKTGYKLFIEDKPPMLVTKPYESYILKTYRINILNNNNWPDQPENGWVIPNFSFSEVKDLIRTMFIVKYLDGVEFLVNILEQSCKQYNNTIKCDYEARDEGYYAAHINIKDNFEIPKIDWDTKTEVINVEIQITTQLQEVIRRLLHLNYEKNRQIQKPEEKWQWDYKSEQFSLNYLGHILHYIEGMIMEIRDKDERSII